MKNLDIELLLMKAWPSLYEEEYDGWILRYSKGYTKRANSVNFISESLLRFEEKVNYCNEFYKGFNKSVVYKLIDDNMEIDRKLEELGLEKREEVSVEECLLDNLIIKESNGYVVWGFSEEWVTFFTKENKLSFQETLILKEILLKNDNNCFYVYEKEENQIVAVAMAVIFGENLCIFNVYVKDGFRKRNYGKKIVYKILEEGKKKNVKRAYLQVLESNKIAKKLYGKIGFVHKYSSWYRY
ncbi:MAG: GNAT family N-acetyltransferase [Fusobacteriaceae bacterium]|nr:GNAT family N-acetyltransferase [Fusobacteriaceae bacterium]